MAVNRKHVVIIGLLAASLALVLVVGLALRARQRTSGQQPPRATDATGPTPDASVSFALTAPPPEYVVEHADVTSGTTPEFALPPGMYWVSFRADGPFEAVTPVVDDGNCSPHPLFLNGAGPFEGSAAYRSTGCRVHLEVSGSSGGWEVAVGAAAEGGLVAVPATFANERVAATDVVDMPEGDYHLTLRTESQYSMVVPLSVEGLCLERPVFLQTQPGAFETTYRSTGCHVIFQVSSVTSAWELSIDRED